MSVGDDFYEKRMDPAEFETRRREAVASLDGAEGEDMRELIAWFVRRYPTPLERLAYCRRKYRESRALHGRALSDASHAASEVLVRRRPG